MERSVPDRQLQVDNIVEAPLKRREEKRTLRHQNFLPSFLSWKTPRHSFPLGLAKGIEDLFANKPKYYLLLSGYGLIFALYRTWHPDCSV
jgi:hypothetical protein